MRLSAYRQILVRCKDLELLGFHHRGYYYVDTRLPFGLRSSSAIHDRYADQLTQFIHILCKVDKTARFSDDTLFVHEPHRPTALGQMAAVTSSQSVWE